jgi:formate-dependent nitrite reductase cytochrome c552 subunit
MTCGQSNCFCVSDEKRTAFHKYADFTDNLYEDRGGSMAMMPCHSDPNQPVMWLVSHSGEGHYFSEAHAKEIVKITYENGKMKLTKIK